MAFFNVSLVIFNKNAIFLISLVLQRKVTFAILRSTMAEPSFLAPAGEESTGALRFPRILAVTDRPSRQSLRTPEAGCLCNVVS